MLTKPSVRWPMIERILSSRVTPSSTIAGDAEARGREHRRLQGAADEEHDRELEGADDEEQQRRREQRELDRGVAAGVAAEVPEPEAARHGPLTPRCAGC
jgi:hypothetical protein